MIDKSPALHLYKEKVLCGQAVGNHRIYVDKAPSLPKIQLRASGRLGAYRALPTEMREIPTVIHKFSTVGGKAIQFGHIYLFQPLFNFLQPP